MGKRISVIPIWKKIGLNSGIEKLIIKLNKNTKQNDKIKIIVKYIHSSWSFSLIFSKIILQIKYLNRRRKIDVVPILFPFIMSCKKPVKNKIVLEGFILNLTIHK